MTFMRLDPHRVLSELILKKHGKVMTVKLDDVRGEIKMIPRQLKLVGGEREKAGSGKAGHNQSVNP